MIFDAILILGGGVREGGSLPPWAQRRFDLAVELQEGEPIVCLSAGTTHRPTPRDEFGMPIFEAVAGARYLISRGIPPAQIRIEAASWDTIGNAYFAKIMHVDPMGWSKLLIITSAFHMPRSRAVFNWVYGLAADRIYDLRFAEASDAGLDESMIAARCNKEVAALEQFQRVATSLSSLRALNEWLFAEHRAYAAAGGASADRTPDPGVRSSY
jgi:hypothetical protein